MAYLMIRKIRNKFINAENNKLRKQTVYTIKSVQSSLKSHPLWVTLYIAGVIDQENRK